VISSRNINNARRAANNGLELVIVAARGAPMSSIELK
jgi:hypothetical protein